MIKFMFNKIGMNVLFNSFRKNYLPLEIIEFICRSGVEEVVEKEEKPSPEKRKLENIPSVMGWTITKPIVHNPLIILKDSSGIIEEVSSPFRGNPLK